MFPGFTTEPVRANGIMVRVCHGGSGPPVLLLHGYPQTHVMWHQVAPALARHFTVICPDLRGYGDQTIDKEHATTVWRYFFLTQPAGLPEHLIGSDPRY